MPRNVNLTTSNWRATGQNVQVAQRELTVTWEWEQDDGTPRTYTRAFRFPNDLAILPAAWVADAMEDLVIRASRRHAWVDD